MICNICPRRCGAERTETYGGGFCRMPAVPVIARAGLHLWEEPVLSGTRGSGAVFFSGCSLGCVYCQNHTISAEGVGKAVTTERLREIFRELIAQGAHNIDLITASHFVPFLLPALEEPLPVPVVFNCGGYERVETVKALHDYVDIWLPDLKYESSELSARYSQAPFYFQAAAKAIAQMIRQTGNPHLKKIPEEAAPVMDRGVIIRHLVLPGSKDDSIRLMHWIAEQLPKDSFYISLMSQYTPYEQNPQFPELNRRITSYEYQKVVDTHRDLCRKKAAPEKNIHRPLIWKACNILRSCAAEHVVSDMI